MRFRIMKKNGGFGYTIVVSGEMDDDSGWDLLQVAQTMLLMPRCRELIVDLRAATLDEELSIFNTDTLVSIFEEGLLLKDSVLVVRFRDDSEIRLCSDQHPLGPVVPYADVRIDEAKFYGRAMKWLAQEVRLLAH